MDQEQSEFNRKQQQKMRNDANNANTIKNAANVAEASGNPYAVAAGKAVNAADKITGGKSTQALGKVMTTANKFSGLKGKMLQAASNKMAESGAGNKIGSAAGKKAGSATAGSNTSDRINNAVQNKNNINKGSNINLKGNNAPPAANSTKKKEAEESATDGGGENFKVSFKVIKWALIASIPIFTVVMFVCLLMSASQIYIKSIGLGNADSLSDSDVEDKINKKQENSEDLSEEVNEDDLGYDIFIEDTQSIAFKNNKLEDANLVQIASTTYLKRKYNEADLEELEDFYPSVKNLSKNYDENMVYDFFFKMYKLYTTYRDKYKVSLDLPLLMSTLTLQSSDMNEVFNSNLSAEDRKKTERTNYDDFDYYYSWSGYITTPTKGTHDMEVLAQRMVSETSSDKCDEPVNGKCYVVDDAKYKEFLKEFLEKKYYLDEVPISEYVFSSTGSSCPTETPFVKYSLTDDQIAQIASLAYQEQGTVKGAAAEASLMANLFEIKGSKYGEGATGLYNYIRNSGWFANSEKHMDSRKASSEIIAAVKSVLVDGKRTLPAYVDEHDCFSDISSATTDGESISKTDRASYVRNNTKLKNVYGSTYTFYSFPDTKSDPFGYTSEKIREEKGEFYYDFDTGEPVNCGSSSNEYANALIELANKELEENAGKDGTKYNKYFNYSPNTPWCANFASYLISNTSVNGVTIYPNIVNFRSASCGTLISNFNNNSNPKVKFYYNDNCSKLSGKNGTSVAYTPKPGDFIFFDWQQTFTDISSKSQDHVGIVEKYSEGIIYTIEGNSSNRVNKRTYSITDCRVIGFGSWY